jgi:predicted nucleotidyltransferase
MKNHLKIIKDLKSLLATKLGKDIQDVILYGSQIKGTNDKESDYDVLIVLNRKYNWVQRRIIRDLCYEISLKYEIIIDSKIISLKELEKSPTGNHPLYLDAIIQGVYA